MTIILILFGLALAAAVFARHTPLGRMMRKALIEHPAAWLDAAGPLKLAVAIGVVLLFIAAPEMAVLGAADLSLFLEVLAAVSLMAAQVRVRRVLRCVQRIVRPMTQIGRTRRQGRERATKSRVRRPRRLGRKDDEPGWGLSPGFA